MNTKITIRPRERDAMLQALRAGVTPRVGLRYIQVGRAREIAETIRDAERIMDGGSAFRLIIGDYGAGKTFFLNLVRLIALEKGLVTVHADLAPDRRLHATAGQARNLFAELMRNMATRTKADGGALKSVVERFISMAVRDAERENSSVADVIHERLNPLAELVSGFDFADVLNRYYAAYESHDEHQSQECLRWLRGEYATKTEARQRLGAREIIDDDRVYDFLKLYARFVRLVGYRGLLVSLDELVNLFKLTSSRARNQNYEQILRVLNDVLQGSAEGLWVLLGGTPEFLLDSRRGLYSYEALHSRLAENRFARDGLVDLSGPVIQLQMLSQEELYVLLCNVRHVFAGGECEKYLLPDEALHRFMRHCSEIIGDAYFRTPRNTIKAFVQLLSVLEQNPAADWRTLIGEVVCEKEQVTENSVEIDSVGKTSADDTDDDKLTAFRL